MRKQTPSQTVGPFYSIGLTRKPMNVMVTDTTQGQRIRIEGQVFDGAGVAIPDVMVEIWQANTYGRYNHPDDKQEKPLDPTFTGWGRSGTDEKCFYTFEPSSPARCREMLNRYKRRTSTLSFLRAVCWCMRTRGYTSPTSRPMRAIRC